MKSPKHSPLAQQTKPIALHPRELARSRHLVSLLFFCIFLALPAHPQNLTPVITVDHGPNAPAQLAKHYVILISFDGFRYDYARRYNATNVLALASRGASAPEGMIPSFPSVTFANHYTLVTGLYPEHHGIVENEFYDPARHEIYSYKVQSTKIDGTWYGGTPLWVLAEQQGMRSAPFFWPGSEADIQGVLPSYYLKYDGHLPNQKRVDQVLAWLRLPAARRPHFITLYFSDTDDQGHKYGPDSPELIAAVHEVDSELGRLTLGLKALKLPVDIILVADHGMARVPSQWIELDKHGLDPSLLEKFQGILLHAKSDADAQRIFDEMQPAPPEYKVYRRADLPERLHFNENPRAGDPVIVPSGAYAIHVQDDPKYPHPNPGAHGFDPALVPEMKAIFVAAGPDIRSGVTVAPFENVNVYPLIAQILGLDIRSLKTGPIEGKLTVLQPILKKSTNLAPAKASN
jgi:predicted AlkP superfamily pyrophosphatase or phosphodiesterase